MKKLLLLAALVASIGAKADTDLAAYFENLDFESSTMTSGYATDIPGWTLDSSLGHQTVWVYNSSNSTYGSVASVEPFSGNILVCSNWFSGTTPTLQAGDFATQTSSVLLPAGIYKLEADVNACTEGTFYVSLNGSKSYATATDWGSISGLEVKVELAEDGYLTIAAGMETDVVYSQWFACYFDNFVVTYLGDDFALPSSTGISAALAPKSTEVYGLGGQRLQKPQRGINIVGGRKVVY